MTNKEKASELAIKLEGEIGTSPHSRLPIEEAFLEMSTWKDQHFEEEKDEIKTDAKKELAWEIHKKISKCTTLAELDNYVCGIVDF